MQVQIEYGFRDACIFDLYTMYMCLYICMCGGVGYVHIMYIRTYIYYMCVWVWLVYVSSKACNVGVCLSFRRVCKRVRIQEDALRIQEDAPMPQPRLTTNCNTQQHIATLCNALQHTTKHCNTPQHTATHCNTLQHIEHIARHW